jgi:hypothetical protein
VSTLKVNNLEDLGADPVVTNGVIEKAALPAGTILQVLQTVKTDAFTTTSSTYVDVTGFSVDITPSFVSSKIMVESSAFYSAGGTTGYPLAKVRLVRVIGGSETVLADPLSLTGVGSDRNPAQVQAGYLDSPATTSTVTYKIQMLRTSTATATFNRNGAGTDAAVATISVMEVAG